jgi:two-component system NtrC family response regulator
MSKILVIDDDPHINALIQSVVRKMDHVCVGAATLAEGLERLCAEPYEVVLLDVHLPDGNGLDMLARIREAPPCPEVIIITGYGDPDAAEMAIMNGAWDYLLKPSSVDHITLAVRRAMAFRQEKAAKGVPRLLKRDAIIGSSAKLNASLERVAQAATAKANVLITGETGTGKELIARAIHENSARCLHRFVVLDCAALPESLVESTLFGHAKGAFTGADQERSGLIQQAHGGTLFLDEIGELPLPAQKAFLRVIQEQRFRPVRGKKEIQVDFRLIAATNRNLDQMADQGRFRPDLLYRLRTFNIETPTLRDRRDDIRPLAVYYLNRLCEIYSSQTKGFSGEFMESLNHYDWPGNVRELFNTLEEALSVAGEEPTLYPHHLPVHIRAALARRVVASSTSTDTGSSQVDPLAHMTRDNFLKIHVFREKMERCYLEKLTLLTRGNRKEACRISGLSRTRLFELLKKYDLSECLRKAPDFQRLAENSTAAHRSSPE